MLLHPYRQGSKQIDDVLIEAMKKVNPFADSNVNYLAIFSALCFFSSTKFVEYPGKTLAEGLM